jgi:hypothetical protein
MTDELTQQQVNQTAWAACDTFRGVVDAGQYKDYILVMLFLKYISDLWNDHAETYRKQYGSDEARIRRRLERERFILPEGSSFYDLYEKRNEANIGELINIALESIEDTNRAKLEGVFRNIDFNSESNLGRVKDRNRRLKNVLEDFAKPALDLRPSRVTGDVIGECYIYLHSCGCLPASRGPRFAEARRHHLRSSLRVRVATDPSGRAGRIRQLRVIWAGGERLDLGARSDEHVPALERRCAHRVVRYAEQPHANRGRPPHEV